MTTTMMTMAVMTTTIGGAAEMPDGVGEEFEAPLERDEAKFGPSGVAAFPCRDRDRPGLGGVGTPTTGLDDHRDPDGGKIEEGKEGGEDGRRDFELASYVA